MADKWGAQLASLDNCGRQKSISLRTLSVHLHLLLLTTVLYLWLCLWVTAFSCWLIFRLWNLVCVFTDCSSKFEYSKLGSRVFKNWGVRISCFFSGFVLVLDGMTRTSQFILNRWLIRVIVVLFSSWQYMCDSGCRLVRGAWSNKLNGTKSWAWNGTKLGRAPFHLSFLFLTLDLKILDLEIS
jgi:hypothetical protein